MYQLRQEVFSNLREENSNILWIPDGEIQNWQLKEPWAHQEDAVYLPSAFANRLGPHLQNVDENNIQLTDFLKRIWQATCTLKNQLIYKD